MKKNLLGVAMSALLMLAIMVIAPTPARASVEECHPGNVCLWGENNYTGCFYQYGDDWDNYAATGWSTCPAYAVNDGANSVRNNGSRCRVKLFLNPFYVGPSIYLNNPARGGITRDPMLRNGGGYSTPEWPNVNVLNWENQFSSHNWWC